MRHVAVECAVEHFDLLVGAQASNVAVASLSNRAESHASDLSSGLHALQSSSRLLLNAGQTWRSERTQLHSAVVHHQKVLTLAEAPALVTECIRSCMFHEALLVFEHIMSLCQQMTSVAVFKRLREETTRALEVAVEENVIPSLFGPLSVDAAYKVISFLRQLGAPNAQLRPLFLHSRSQFIKKLQGEAQASAIPYSCLLKYVASYKVHVNEAVLQFMTCFPMNGADATAAEAELCVWCQEQATQFMRLMSEALQNLQNGSELALIIQQCSSCATASARLHVDVSGMLSGVLIGRVLFIFSSSMRLARSAYTTSMQTSSWRVPAYYHGASAFATSFSATVGEAPVCSDTPSMQLTQLLPLAYALNGILSSFNAIRKCLLPGVADPCGAEVYRFVNEVAQDMLSDAALMESMSENEHTVFIAFLKAFKLLFLPHVLYVVEKVLGHATRESLEDRLQEAVHGITEILFIVDARAATADAPLETTASPSAASPPSGMTQASAS